jgi:hypothetical protein
MGLDITAYRKLTKIENPVLDEYGEPEDYDNTLSIHGALIDFSNTFAGTKRAADLAVGHYSFADSMDFRAGSYGGYNQWRDWLARVAGHGTADKVWNDDISEGPFIELIQFADNEGYIGPAVSAKLAKDFADNEERIVAIGGTDSYFLDKYREWRAAFEMAADGGCVDFH